MTNHTNKVTYKRIDIDGKLVSVSEFEGKTGKFCSNCLEFLPPEAYNIRYTDGRHFLNSQCQCCNTKSTRKWRNVSPRNRLVHSVKARAKRNGLAFDMDIDTLEIPDVCPILGIPLEAGYGVRSENTITIDRIDNSKGYTKDNIVLCSWRANRLKNDATLDELRNIKAFVSAHHISDNLD